MVQAIRDFTTQSESLLERVSVLMAYVGSLALWWVSRLSIPHNDVGAKAAAGWIVLLCLPIWLIICLIAIRSGGRLGGAWKWLAWPPLAVPVIWFIANGFMQVDWTRLFQ